MHDSPMHDTPMHDTLADGLIEAPGVGDMSYGLLEGPAALVFSDDEDRGARFAAIARAHGARAVATLPVGAAQARLDLQVSGLVLLDVAGDPGTALDRMLDRIAAAADGSLGCVVIAQPAMLDVVARLIGNRHVELLVDPRDDDIGFAIDSLLASRVPRLEDSAGEASGARLRQLSDEIGRIARTLAGLSAGLDAAPAVTVEPRGTATRLQTVRTEIRLRRMREQFFDRALFADPAWDVLLDLIAAELERRRVAVSSLCIAASVPATTALRWIAQMTEQGLLTRYPDPDDGRRVFIALTETASAGMIRYLDACSGLRLS